MNRPKTPALSALALVTAAVLTPSVSPQAAHAQAGVTRARIDGRAGDVTGLELSLEGGRTAPRGGRMRWLLTVHEVVGLSDLRPAPRVRVRVLSSLVRDRALAEATTDALGRVETELQVPADAPDHFRVVFEAVSPRGVRRQFDLDVTASSSQRITLDGARRAVRRGETVRLWGRVASAVDGAAVANREVLITAHAAYNGTTLPQVSVRTDAAGVYSHEFVAPAEASGALQFTARTAGTEDTTSASFSVVISAPSRPAMIALAATQQPVARAGEPVDVDVIVRTGDGRALRNASVQSAFIPRPSGRAEAVTLYTDARGRAHFRFPAPTVGEAFRDLAIPVSVGRTGVGSVSATATVRLVRAAFAGSVAVEAGALSPEIPGRIYVRVVRTDGLPAPAGVPVALSGPRIPTNTTAVTDENGVALVEVRLQRPPAARPRPARRPAPPRRPAGGDEDSDESADGDDEANAPPEDSCGGTTATAVTATLGAAGATQGSVSGCLAVDPDAAARVRLVDGVLVRPGATVSATVTRVAGVRSWPVELALVALDGASQTPRTAVVLPPGTDRGSLAIPADLVGAFLVRARPLHPTLGQPVRGSFAAGLSIRGGRVGLDVESGAEPGALALRAAGDAGVLEGLTGTVVVLPAADAADLLTRARGRSALGWLGDLRVPEARIGGALLEGTLASHLKPDQGAPSVLRGGRPVPQPAPDDPVSAGILRDPWRSRGRFVEGRLARFFRAIENHVSESLLEHREDVAVRSPAGRWDFNREILDALATGSDEGGAPRALGGGPLTIEVLRRLDPAFTYDAVARRITRRRAFILLLALRNFVNEHALDLRWSWRGDPTTWLDALAENSVSYGAGGEGDGTVEQTHLRDGWGNRFVLRPAPGGRARFSVLAPVPGFELVSAGPDGRFGTGDDVFNPFARVLPSGGAYARAVDEDGLLARLNGVELGRATIGSLTEVFEAEGTDVSEASEDDGGHSLMDWTALPPRLPDHTHALDVLRPTLRVQPSAAHGVALGGGSAQVRAALDDELRTYTAVVEAWGPLGQSAVSSVSFSAGRPVLFDLPLRSDADTPPPAPRLVLGEDIEVPLAVSNLTESPQTYRIESAGDGVTATVAPTLTVPGGESATALVRLRGARVGEGRVALTLRDAQGAPLRSTEVPVFVDAGGLGLRDDVTALARSDVRDQRRLSLDLRASGRISTARLVLVSPASLGDDPEFGRVRRMDPALIAWHDAMGSRRPSAELEAALYSAQSTDGRVAASFARDPSRGSGTVASSSAALSTACALLVWSGAAEEDTRASAARERAAGALLRSRGAFPDTDPTAGRLREGAAIVAALATGASESTSDPVGMLLAQLRQELRNADEAFAAQPTLLARAAAALLLADPADERGAALYDHARRAVRTERGVSWLPGVDDRARRDEEFAATAALAVAAQQRGDTALARALSLGVGEHALRAMRLGGEPAFWLLAASAYGVFGLGAPTAARVSGDGLSEATVSLSRGVALVPVALEGGGERAVFVRGEGPAGEATAVFARLEALHERPYRAVNDGPVELLLEGDAGFADETGALELTVRNTQSRPLRRLAVELVLPAGALLEDPARAAISQRAGVSSVEVRPGGVVRVVASLAAEGSVTLPLAVRWVARGALRGFAAVAYEEDQPWRMTVAPAQRYEIAPRPDEQQTVAH